MKTGKIFGAFLYKKEKAGVSSKERGDIHDQRNEQNRCNICPVENI